MQALLPVGRNPVRGSGRGLAQWVMLGRGELRAVVHLLVPIVVVPALPGLVTGDPRMSCGFGMGGGVLAGGTVTAADVAALSAAAEVKPPALIALALDAAGATGPHRGIDTGLFDHHLRKRRFGHVRNRLERLSRYR